MCAASIYNLRLAKRFNASWLHFFQYIQCELAEYIIWLIFSEAVSKARMDSSCLHYLYYFRSFGQERTTGWKQIIRSKKNKLLQIFWFVTIVIDNAPLFDLAAKMVRYIISFSFFSFEDLESDFSVQRRKHTDHICTAYTTSCHVTYREARGSIFLFHFGYISSAQVVSGCLVRNIRYSTSITPSRTRATEDTTVA